MKLYTQLTVVVSYLEDHFEQYGEYPQFISEVRSTHACESPVCRQCRMSFEQAIGPDPWGNPLGYLADGSNYLLWSIGSDRSLDAEWIFGLHDSEIGETDTVLVTTCPVQWWEGSQPPNVLGEKISGDDARRIGRVLEARMREPFGL